MRFRPCIDIHEGRVKQIVGGSLSETDESSIVTNFVSLKGPEHFARLYSDHGLTGGHVIMLGPGNEAAAERALRAYPGGLQVGGGIDPRNARHWIGCGAAKVIVTSCIFRNGIIDWAVLKELCAVAGRESVVIDLSCRRLGNEYRVVTDRWQTFTDLALGEGTLAELTPYCSEFLVHGVDVEGLKLGIERDLVEGLCRWSALTVTYAGGVRNMSDLLLIEKLGKGRIDATAGSSLDIFGGTGLRFADVVEFDKARR